MIYGLFQQVGRGGELEPSFTRRFNDWELDEEDRVRWLVSKDGNFSVKSLYKVLESDSSVCFPMKIIWNSWVQPKISLFAWEASWGKALTLDQI